jgi:hypothetical protein
MLKSQNAPFANRNLDRGHLGDITVEFVVELFVQILGRLAQQKLD